VAFAYIKATEADDFKDQNFSKNWSAAKKTAIAVGAYHYFSLAYGGEVQADNFISSVPVETTSLPPVVDLEYVGNSSKRPSKSDFHKELSIFLSAVTDHYGKQPIIYTTKEFYRDYLDPEFATNPTWIRDLFLPPKNHWVLWQYSQWGSIDGINGSVDLDYFGGNVEKLRNL
jgi:lysozyme